MPELARLVQDFAMAIKIADGRRPQAAGPGRRRLYQPGIGPHTEGQTLSLVIKELVILDAAYAAYRLNVPYPVAPRQKCDWCLGSPPMWSWSIEVKMFKLYGDNEKLNDNMLMHVLSPYPQHRSALSDCDKLVNFNMTARKAILIFGYDYAGWPMDPAIEAFEVLTSLRVELGSRHEAGYRNLIHPVHQHGRVFAWEIAHAQSLRASNQ